VTAANGTAPEGKEISRPFQDKVAIVTGASSGIGRATVLALARRGAHIALAARRVNLLEEVAAEAQAYGGQALVLPTDISDPVQVSKMVEAALERFGRVDILVANAGVYVRSPLEELTTEKIQYAMAVNFYGGVYAILSVLPHMRSQGSGHIVVVTSVDGKKGLPLDAPYASAKFALTGFAEVLRQELHGSGIYVCTILPGRVDTGMIEDLRVPWISAKIPAEMVANAIVGAILKHKAEAIIPFQASLLVYLNTFFPRLADWVVRYFHLEGWPE
jgi:NAD(P)-dependent dehydrogenase (short-subunit alcohol dehydrogenase family)